MAPSEMIYRGQCHCGAIGVQLISDTLPGDQILGACQCSFCRKHNARAFSDPRAQVTLTAADREQLQLYTFDLKTSKQLICRQCGVYVAMILADGDQVLGVLNIDTLDDRALFTSEPQARDYSAEGSARPNCAKKGALDANNPDWLAVACLRAPPPKTQFPFITAGGVHEPSMIAVFGQ
jgi:hypothetical protein